MVTVLYITDREGYTMALLLVKYQSLTSYLSTWWRTPLSRMIRSLTLVRTHHHYISLYIVYNLWVRSLVF